MTPCRRSGRKPWSSARIAIRRTSAACCCPVVVDGMISAAAALLAIRLAPKVGAALLPSHCSSEPAGALLLEALGMKAPIQAGLHLGEGSGAVMLMPLLDMALSVYRSGQTFERLGIPAYQPFPEGDRQS